MVADLITLLIAPNSQGIASNGFGCYSSTANQESDALLNGLKLQSNSWAIAMLQFQLLGHFHLSHDGVPVTTIHQARLQSLLAYLILHKQTPQSRRHLAFLFWPDSSEMQARTNLRRALHYLRLALPDADQYLNTHTQWVQWRGEVTFSLDVSNFEQLIAQAQGMVYARQSNELVVTLERAVTLYRGPFLIGCYEEWVVARREELEQWFVWALDNLITLYETRRNYTAALSYAQRLLRHDPLRETTYQQLMRLYVLCGDRAGALRLFQECVAVLLRELGVEPSAETVAAHLQLLKDDSGLTQALQPPARLGNTSLLVGRQAEWQQLLMAWQQATQGQAHVVAITGEAGIGKTILAETFADWVRQQGQRVAAARAYEADGPLAFAPLGELFRSESLAASMTELSALWLAQIARLLPELLERHRDLPHPGIVNDPLQRQHFLEALARAVLVKDQPLLLLLDDLQWAGREALEWLHFLLRYAPQARLLLVVTIRSGKVAADHPLHRLLLALRRAQSLSEIPLDHFSPDDTATLAAQIAGRVLDPAHSRELHHQTGGNPFFVVELMRANVAHWAIGGDFSLHLTVTTGQDSQWPKLALPDQVQAVIQSRLAQLTPLAQEVARLAAIIGRSFELETLVRAGNYDEGEVIHSLEELWRCHIVREVGTSAYDFIHPILRDVAYRQISPLRRRMFHRRIAQALEQEHRTQPHIASGFIATHYQLAGDASRAIAAYQQAAHFAKQTYAYGDAADILHKALALLQRLPEESSRHQLELAIHLDLGWALMMTKSWSDPQAQIAYERALELSLYAETKAHLFEASWGLHEIYLFQGIQEKARVAADRCWLLAQQSGDPELLFQAHHAYWGIYHWFYDGPDGLQKAHDHAQQGVKLYEPAWHQKHLLRFGAHDPGVCAHGILSVSQWFLGYPDQAVETQRAAIDLANQLGHVESTVMAWDQMARIHYYRREPRLVLDAVEKVQQAASGRDRPVNAAQQLVFRGWAQGQLDATIAAAEMVRQGVSIWQAKKMMVDLSSFLILLAETYEQAKCIDAAQKAVVEALHIALEIGEEAFLPEIYRLRGRYLLAMGERHQAQASFEQAMTLARTQQAKSLELRAAIELGQLWIEHGKAYESYELLAPIYEWFTEGFESADLCSARNLLRTLSTR